MAEMIDIVKQIAKGVTDSSAPCDVCFGVVTSVNPLVITVEQKLVLTEEFLILTKNVKDYTVDVTMNWQTETKVLNANHTHQGSGSITIESTVDPNPDNINITNNVQSEIIIKETNINLNHNHGISGTKSVTIHNALKSGDNVILIQKLGGQEYIVLDKI